MLSSVRSRIRLLPVTLIAVAALTGLKAADLWQGGRFLGAANAVAQTTPTATPAAKPAAGTTAAPKAEEVKVEDKAAAMRSPMREPTRTMANVLPREGGYSAAELEVLQNLSKRREELDQREQGIAAREALLTAAEKRIEARIGEMKTLEAKLTTLANQRGEEEEKRLRGLVKVYESMKPADAARIFQELEMPVLLEVAERMKEAKLGPILAQMNPRKARAMTVELAGRRGAGEEPQKAEPAPAKPEPASAPKAEAILPKGKPS